MRFIQSAGLTLSMKLLSLAFGLGVSVLIGRVLGTDGRGIYGLVMTVVILASSFGVFGFGSASTYFVAQDRKYARAAGVQSVIVGMIGAVLSTAVVLAVWWWIPSALKGLNGEILFATVILLTIYLLGNLFSKAYLGLGDVVSFNAFETLSRTLLFVAGLVTLLWMNLGLDSYLFIVAVCLVVFILIYIVRYFSVTQSQPATLPDLMKRSLAYGMRAYVAATFTWVTIRSGIFFVNHFAGTSDAGLFSVAQQLSEMLIIIPSVLGTLLFPRVAEGDSKDLTAKVLRTMLLVFLPVSILLAIFAEPLIVVLYGQEFAESGTVLLILLPGALLLGLEVIAAGDIAGRGYPWSAALIWVPLFGLNAVGYMILIPRFGINGAALSTSITFALAFVFMAFYLKKLSGFGLSQMFVPRVEDIKTMFRSLGRGLKSNK